MSNDELLQQLANLAREDRDEELARLDERWDRLAAGDLSAAEETALRALGVSEPLARRAWEAFRPLGADFHQRVTGEVRRAAGAEAPPVAAAAPAPQARVLGRGRRWSRQATGWLTAAAAAALILVVLRPGPQAWSSLPAYDLQLAPGVQELRGAPVPETAGAVPDFAPGSRFELVLRPERAVSGEVAARAFLAREGEPPAPWHVPVEVAPSGAVRLSGVLGQDLDLAPGSWHLWLAVGRPGHLPAAEDLATAGEWHLMEASFRVLAQEAPAEPGI